MLTKNHAAGWIPPPEYVEIPSGYLTVRHGIDGPSIDGLPIKNGDFPGYVK